MDDRYSYPPNYPPRNDLISDFGSLAAMDNFDSMSPYIYAPPSQYNPYHYVPPVPPPVSNSSLFTSHSPSTSGSGSGIGGGSSADLNADSFYSPTGSDDPFSDEPPLLEELGINFEQFMQKSMMIGSPFTPNSNTNSNTTKSESNILHESDLNDLLIEKEGGNCTRSPNHLSPSTNDTTSIDHHQNLPSPENSNNYVDERSVQVIYQDNTQTSNHVCDNLIVSSNNPHGNGSGSGGGGGNTDTDGQVNRLDSQDDGQLINSWEKSIPDELNYPFDSRLPRPSNNRFTSTPNSTSNNNLNHNLNVNPSHNTTTTSSNGNTGNILPKLHSIGHQFVTSGGGHSSRPPPTNLNYSQLHRQILPSLQPNPTTTTTLGYPGYTQRPVAIQPNLTYTHKVSPRFMSPYTCNVEGRNIIFWTPNPPTTTRKLYPQSSPITTTSSATINPPGSHHHHHHHQHPSPHLATASFSQLQEATTAPGPTVHNRVPIMISAGRVAFTSSPLDDSSSPSSTCSTSSCSTSPTGITMDKKLYMNNPLLVNMLTCPQIPGLRNLAPAPDSSSSHLDEKSKSEVLSGLLDVSSDKRKRSNRTVATANREPIKREMRPKIFDIEQFKIGLFHVQSSNEGMTRRNSSTQLKVIFSKKRFIYEFAFSASYTYDKKDQQPEIMSVQPSSNTGYRCTSSSSTSTNNVTSICGVGNGGNNVNSASNHISRIQSTTNGNNTNTKNDPPSVVYYVIAVPFDTITGLNIDESTMYLTVDRVPFLFGGTSIRSKVLFEKAPRFDPSQGELDSNGLHCISLRASQVGRLRTSLIEFDKRFAELLSNKIDRDPYSYRYKLSETSKDTKEEDKGTLFSSDRSMVNQQHQHHHHQHQHLHHQQQHQLPDSVQPSKKQKLINKVDYKDVESPSQSNNGLLDLS